MPLYAFYIDICMLLNKTKQKTTGFYPTNESADCWPAMHSYIFIFRVK